MTVLVDKQIRAEIESGRIVIDPYDSSLVNPASLDIRLGNKFAVLKATGKYYWHDPIAQMDRVGIDITNPESFEYDYYDSDVFMLEPLGFCLGVMAETVKLPDDISFKLFGKSSWARLGLDNSSPGAWVECGFPGSIVLEFFNQTPFHQKLTAGSRCGQLVFFKHARAETAYDKHAQSRYKNQVGVVGSKGV